MVEGEYSRVFEVELRLFPGAAGETNIVELWLPDRNVVRPTVENGLANILGFSCANRRRQRRRRRTLKETEEAVALQA
jgi:hypothetical protein